MEEGEKIVPVVELFHGLVMITDNKPSSLIITGPTNSGVEMDDTQVIIALGPHVKAENGMNLKVGDDVLINFSRLFTVDNTGKVKKVPGATIGQYICFDNKTGKFDGFEKKDANTGYWIIDSRTIICKV